MAFDHERLDVYRIALDLLVLTDDTIEHLPRGRSHLADQLSRASTCFSGAFSVIHIPPVWGSTTPVAARGRSARS